MAQARYTRIDNNKKSSSSFCSTVTIVVFVALCLVGVWMMTSSSVVPAQNADVTQDNKNDAAQDNKNDIKEAQSDTKEQVTDNDNSGNTRQFEDNQGDLPEDATKGDTNITPENNSDVKEKQEEKSENKSEEKPSEEFKTEDGDKKTEDKDSPTENTESNPQATENKDSDETEKSGSGDSEKKSESDESDTKSESNENKQSDSDESLNKSDSDGSEKKFDDSSETTDNKTEEKVQQSDKETDESSIEKETDDSTNKKTSTEVYASGGQSELLNESTTQSGSFSTQAAESKNEKESQESSKQYNWKLCNSTAGPDYIPCLDNLKAIRSLPSTKHYEHRERHCPEEPPTCLVPLPEGYRRPITWPKSREKIWYYNVPHTKLAEYKGHQNWVKVTGEYLTFPGGGTQFKHGALHYIDTIQQSVPEIAWGKRTRVILDVGCGVASFGGFLFERDVLAMSLAPKDEHEAQVQFALERGIPAISAVMGTVRLPYPGRVFDIVHCARCRVPWHIEGGKLLLELNRVLRPGGFFVWSATPIYQNKTEDVEIWNEMKKLIKKMCWEVVNITRDKLNGVGIATNIPLQSCMHKVPVSSSERGSQWPEQWPARLTNVPYWLTSSQVGVYGKPAPDDFTADYEHWKRVVSKYVDGMGIQWSNVRNVMDMRAVYGGFAAAMKDLNIWVMNVVSVDAPDTLPIIYERGLFGMYHDWCESFSTYPRSYDLLHADHLFSRLKKRCNLEAVVAEADRILRPEGMLIVRDTAEIISELESMVKAMNWEVRMTYTKDNEGFLGARKTMWRPTETVTLEYAF
ncbi:hypothetical protein PIB30_058932 [Stylosanthes scabra]|uniref:Methyltransferase PMT26 n=1 Tax=Stylosanthes scabra TaxID=79078 RepID=A0ABU6VIB7_9FABA|nr:hypothetical protein [Stylosanthes scabra]